MSEKDTLPEPAEESFVIESDEPEALAPESEQAGQEPEAPAAAETGDPQEEKVTFDEKQQEWLNSREAKHKRRERELEQERERLAREMDELRQKLPKDTRPEIPPIPDQYDDQYVEKLKARDEAVAKAAAWDAAERERSNIRVQQEREQVQKQQQAFVQTVQGYTERAEKLGVSKTELEQAGRMVASYNLPDMVALYVLDDDQGPLITKYLSRNPLELEQIKNMPQHRAIAHIASTIKQKAAGLKPKPNLPPEPTESLKGLGAREKERGPAGATFE